MVIPRIISVSELAVRFRSTRILAVIALDEIVVMPATKISSLNGNPAKKPKSRPTPRNTIVAVLPIKRKSMIPRCGACGPTNIPMMI